MYGTAPAPGFGHQLSNIAIHPAGPPLQLAKKKFRGVKMSLDEFQQTDPKELERRLEEDREVRRAKAARPAARREQHKQIRFDKDKKTNMDNWSGDHPELAGSHHKFPKRTLGWLDKRMTPEQRRKRNATLHLDRNAGPTSLARLPSMLIPWGADKVASDTRQDDPEHTKEGMDMVETESGQLSPRSRSYSDLALTYSQIHKRLGATGGQTMTDEEADQVTQHFREAEEWHHAIEKDSTKPADYGSSFWKEDPDARGERRWSKSRVPVSKYQGKQRDPDAYDRERALQDEELRKKEVARKLGHTPVSSMSGMQQLMLGDYFKM
jgi:hypothetical protein